MVSEYGTKIALVGILKLRKTIEFTGFKKTIDKMFGKWTIWHFVTIKIMLFHSITKTNFRFMPLWKVSLLFNWISLHSVLFEVEPTYRKLKTFNYFVRAEMYWYACTDHIFFHKFIYTRFVNGVFLNWIHFSYIVTSIRTASHQQNAFVISYS